MNFIRGSHYPKAPAFADACDQLGILFWSENCFWGGFGGGPGGWSYSGSYPSNSADYDKYDANVLASLTEMIRIHRNHPSIIVWSMGNEDFFTGSGPGDRVISLLKKSVALTHQLDPLPNGRPAAIGGAQSKIGSTEPGTLGDIAGYNGDGTGYDNPGIPNMVSEYGADVSSTRPGNYDPGWANLTVSNGTAAQPAWRSGISRWCMFDYGSQMSAQYINSGIIDNFRIPKRAYYWYRNANLNVAAAHVAGRGHGGGVEAHVEHHHAFRGGRHPRRVALRHRRGCQRQGAQQQRDGHADHQVWPRRVPHRSQHHLHPAGQRFGVRYRDSRWPGRDRVPQLLLRHHGHRGDLDGLDQLQRHHHLAGQPRLRRGNHAESASTPVPP